MVVCAAAFVVLVVLNLVQQRRGEVGARLGPLALGEFREDLHDPVVVLEGGLTALEDLGARLDQAEPVRRGKAQHPGEHEHRQLLGVVGHEVGTPGVGERVDLLVREVRDMPPDAPGGRRLQPVGDGAAQPAVRFAVLGHTVGAPADHRHDRRGLLDPAVPPVPPDPRVPAELAGVVEHPPVVPVAEDQPGGHVTFEQDRRDRAVLLAQPLVDAHRVGRGVRAVQPGQVGPVVGDRAAPRGLETRFGLIVHRGSRATAERSLRWWISATRTSRLEVRSRASKATTGVCSGMSRASRISSAG